MRIFISNLGEDITSNDLRTLLSKFGTVTEVHVPTDDLGNSRGFGYVVMPDNKEAEQAMRTLNKKKFMEQFLSMNEANHSESQHSRAAIW